MSEYMDILHLSVLSGTGQFRLVNRCVKLYA